MIVRIYRLRWSIDRENSHLSFWDKNRDLNVEIWF